MRNIGQDSEVCLHPCMMDKDRKMGYLNAHQLHIVYHYVQLRADVLSACISNF
jgi:hypothetical protein